MCWRASPEGKIAFPLCWGAGKFYKQLFARCFDLSGNVKRHHERERERERCRRPMIISPPPLFHRLVPHLLLFLCHGWCFCLAAPVTATDGAGFRTDTPATATAATAAAAQEKLRGSERRAAELEAALAEVRKTEAGVRAGAQAAALEADQALRTVREVWGRGSGCGVVGTRMRLPIFVSLYPPLLHPILVKY